MDLSSRYRGALLGLATGDAVGTTLEFQQPGSFTPLTDMVGGGPFGLQPGQWTDDTSMALCMAESLVETGRFDPVDQLQRYLRWYREGHWSSTGRCFDIGTATREALHRFERIGEPWCGSPNPQKAGNGSLMRLAPVVLFFADDPAEAVTWAGESSRTTHQAPAAVDACRYFAALLLDVLRGQAKAELLADPHTELNLMPDVAAVAAGSFRARQPPEIRGTGYVVRSLEAALWAFHGSDNFRDGCLKAVNLGDDADTTGAIYGQIAGAYYGVDNIPAPWREQVTWRTKIEQLADMLMRPEHGQHLRRCLS